MNFFRCYGKFHSKEKQRRIPSTEIRSAIRRMIIMRINFAALFVIIAIMNVCASVYAQNITLSFKNAPLKAILTEINKQTGYELWYNNKHLSKAQPVTIIVKNSTLKGVLDQCFHGQPLSYEIINKTIVIKPKPKPLTLFERINNYVKSIRVTGLVTDEKQKPIAGVTVKVKRANAAVITGSDGKYSIEVPDENSVLQFTYVGFEMVEQTVAQNVIVNVTLKEAVGRLEEFEIVSTGYQTIPKERATGSFGHISNELYNRQLSTDVISRLKAVAPSLLFDERSGTTKLNIRGQSTIFANNQPLIVVDNFPFDGDINTINPNDVESITILRDAAAASIWGVRAGNGVIVITTKKGTYEKTALISINSNVTIGSKPDLFYTPQMLPSDFIDLEVSLFSQGRYNDQLNNLQTMPAVSPVVDILDSQRKGILSADVANAMIQSLKLNDVRNDLQDNFYQNSINQQYATTLNGGGKNYSYYMSAGYDNNASNRIGNKYQRISLNTNNSYKPSKHSEIGVNIVHTQSNVNTDNTIDNIRMSGTQNMYPYAKLVSSNREGLSIVKDYRSSFVSNSVTSGYLDWAYKPYDELRFSDNENKTVSTRVNSYLRYNFIKGLSADIRYQYERQAFNNRTLQGANTYYTRDMINSFTTVVNSVLQRNIPLGGILTTQDQALAGHNGRFQANYQTLWGDHELNVLAGIEARQVRTNGYGGKYYGYQDATGATANVNYTNSFILYPKGTGALIPGPNAISATVDRFRSYFFNGAYTYKGKYTLSASARRDESNLFGVDANQKGIPLWSTGLSWNIVKEQFYNLPLDVLKLRASYGYNGNFDNTVTAFTTARYSGNWVFTQQPYAILSSPPNAYLSWERTGMLNIGLDFSTLKNRLSGSFDLFFKRGKDLLGYGNLNPTTGFTTYKGNIASSKGNGFDVLLNSVNTNGVFQWKTDFLFSYVSDRVTSYEQQPNLSDLFIDYSALNGGNPIPVIGRPLYGIYSYRWAGLSGNNGDPTGYVNGVPSADYATIQTQPMASETIRYHGRATPQLFGALRNTFNYKGISLSANISYKFGYYFRRSSINYTNLVNGYITHSDYSRRWQKAGDEALTDVPSFTYPVNSARDYFYSRSEVLVERGDHIRLQDIQLCYTLNPRWLSRLPFVNLQLYAYANNIGILWRENTNNIDPDYGNLIPAPRTIAFGIKSNFK